MQTNSTNHKQTPGSLFKPCRLRVLEENTPLITWGREVHKEANARQSSMKGKEGPSLISRKLELFARQMLGKLPSAWKMPSGTELNRTELRG